MVLQQVVLSLHTVIWKICICQKRNQKLFRRKAMKNSVRFLEKFLHKNKKLYSHWYRSGTEVADRGSSLKSASMCVTGLGMLVSNFSSAAGKQGLMEQSSYKLQRGADSPFLARTSAASLPSVKRVACRTNQSIWLPGDIRASAKTKCSFRWKKN